MSWRCSGNVRTSKSCTVSRSSGNTELGRRLAHLARERVRREALRQRAGRDRERDVPHLAAALDEPRHRAAAAELAVIGVRRQHERPPPLLDQTGTASFCSTAGCRHAPHRHEERRGKRDEAEEPPHHRILEECVVEERVAEDRREREARRRARPRPARRNACRNTATSSHAKSASPTTPVSAATVTGVSCDAAVFGSLPFSFGNTRSAYARLKPPTPTPRTGCAFAIRIPLATRLARPLEALFSPLVVWCCSERRICG